MGLNRQLIGNASDMASICVRRFGKVQLEPERFDCPHLIGSIEWTERDRRIRAMLASKDDTELT